MSEIPTTPSRLAIIIGSVREGRFGPTVASWIADQAAAHGGFDVDVIDLADYDIPLRLPAASPKYAGDSYPRPDGMAGLTDALDAADAFIVVTPEYNHSYPAGLKHAIDVVHGGWARKPVGFVSYGGISGGLRAVEHLRPVFAELHATTIRETVSFAMAHGAFEGDTPIDREGAELAAKVLLDDLAWWARALRNARNAAA